MGVHYCPLAISYLLEKTPITTVKKWLGHENLKNTAIYLDIVNEEEYNEAQKIWPELRDLENQMM